MRLNCDRARSMSWKVSPKRESSTIPADTYLVSAPVSNWGEAYGSMAVSSFFVDRRAVAVAGNGREGAPAAGGVASGCNGWAWRRCEGDAVNASVDDAPWRRIAAVKHAYVAKIFMMAHSYFGTEVLTNGTYV